MEMSHNYWEEIPNIQHVKYENNLNFSTAPCSEDDSEYGPYKKSKVSRQDPMSHRIIEKRRRDRMNNCLADLSRLIPAEYLKKGRGRVEKTEIIEMAIKHMKKLQQEVVCPSDHYRLGYQECMSETMRFMVEVEGHFPREAVCVRLLNHLQKHCETLCRTSPIHATHHHHMREEDVPENGIGNNERRIVMSGEYAITPKLEPNNNNSNHNNNNNNNDNDQHRHNIINPLLQHVERPRDCSDMENCERNSSETYKYKTDIKLRFNQDLHAVQNRVRRQKVDNGGGRRNSVNSSENHSSSQSSPPSSEPCTRISSSECENIHRISPTGSSVSQTNNIARSDSIVGRGSFGSALKLTNHHNNDHHHNNSNNNGHHLSSSNPNAVTDVKNNFSVPIFVLHAKGSFYVPLTIDYSALLPYLNNYDLLEVAPRASSIVLHPVTINVNFLPATIKEQHKSDYMDNNGNKWL